MNLSFLFFDWSVVSSFILKGFYFSVQLTLFAMQAGEETSRPIEMDLAVTVLYFVSAFAINRIAALIERKLQVPGMGVGK